jgi:nitroreductase/ketosteroid isomerase-like protein
MGKSEDFKILERRMCIMAFIGSFILCLLASILIGHIWSGWEIISAKKIYFFLTFLLVLTTFAQAGEEITRNRPGLSLKETFDLYVRSIHNSDLEGLFTTVTDSDDFFFLTADGRILNRDEYYEFHQEWFKATDWKMPVELLKVKEGKEYGYTYAIFYYKIKLPDGKVYNLDSYFTLIFRKENGMWKVVGDACTPIKRYISLPDANIEYNMDQMYLFDTIKNRRTVRKFKSDPVPKEHITKILDAARFAPTSGNVQPWRFVIVKDRQRLDSLAELLQKSWKKRVTAHEGLDEEKKKSYIQGGKEAIQNAMTAPVYILVFVDSTTYPKYALWDGCLAVENLMLAAKSLGYGTGFFTTYFPEEVIRSFVKAPDNLQFLCATPVGIPEKWPEMPEKKELEEFIVYDSFEKK